MKVRIDRSKCTGVANCTAMLPKVFKLDAEGIAVVIDPTAADDNALFAAAEACPPGAIILEDETGRRLYP